MKVIFLKNLENVGREGEVKNVADGYARNFLFPRKFAMPAADVLIKQYENKKKSVQAATQKSKKQLEQAANRIKGLVVSLGRKTTESGQKLYAAVSESDIKKELAHLGYDIGSATVAIKKPIKELGSYELTVDFGNNIQEKFKLNINKE